MRPPLDLANEGHAVQLQKAGRHGVILGCSGYSNLQSANPVDLIVVDLRENDLLPYPDGEVPSSVKPPAWHAAKVPDTR